MIYERLSSEPSHRPAVVSSGLTFTYGEIAQGAAGLMDSVRSLPFYMTGGESPVLFLEEMIACLHMGTTVVPLPPSVGSATRHQIRNRLVSGSLEDIDHVGLISLTSGSCGASKLVVRPWDNLEDEAAAASKHLGLTGDSCVCVMTPLAHSFGCGLWRATLCSGATLLVPNSEDVHSRLMEIRDILEAGVDFVFGVPYLFRVLARHGVKVTGHPRCFAGGETLTESTFLSWKEATGLELQQEYGLSEGGITTLARPTTNFRSIGVPIPGVHLKVDNPDDCGIGELVVYRPYAPSRYLFEGVGNTFQEDGGIRTGDLGHYDAVSGEYYFNGRLKSVIVVAGLKMVPEEVESVIRKHPWVEDVAVVGTPDPVTGEKPIAFVVTKSGEGMTGTIRQMLKDELDSYKVPKRIVMLDGLPRTASGKVDRNALSKL